jgi:hypothetical protein
MRPDIYRADSLFQGTPPPLSDYGRRLLAEGDSWFTIGTINLPHSSNVLQEFEFSQSTAIVTSAYPGDTMKRMVDGVNDPYFDRLLRRRPFASFWEAILISAGGNDLIDAAQVPPLDANGAPVPPGQRLLLQPGEAPAGAVGAARYISESGWARLADYLAANFAELVARREQSPSKGRPIIAHTYAVPTVRPSGTVGSPNGWLFPAMQRYGIPDVDRQPVCSELFQRLRALLLSLDQTSGSPRALPAVRVFDSAALATIVPAAPGTSGSSGDWVNEIHLTPGGYRKMGTAMGAWAEPLM